MKNSKGICPIISLMKLRGLQKNALEFREVNYQNRQESLGTNQ
jgi:hypothetical protein